MTIHLIGTSHIVALRQAFIGKRPEPKHFWGKVRAAIFPDNPPPVTKYASKCLWYYSNNSDYQAGEFVWGHDGLTHTSAAVTAVWNRTVKSRTVNAQPGDTIVAFGFDDRFDRYNFLAGKADHVSTACRAQTIRDLTRVSPALRLISLFHDNRPGVRLIMVEPPLLSRSKQAQKFVDRLVLKRCVNELWHHHAAIASEYGAAHLVQPEETLQTEGDYLYTRNSFLAADGYHWSAKGINALCRDLMPVIDAGAR